MENGISPEHPQASTTDDVEYFFSVLRDTVGKDFTLKEVNTGQFSVVHTFLYVQVFYSRRKVTHEFLKRMDPDLPFYYHTSTHTRFYEGVLPGFDTQRSKKPWMKRIPRYKLLGTMTESIWLFVVPAQYEFNFTMYLWNFLFHQE